MDQTNVKIFVDLKVIASISSNGTIEALNDTIQLWEYLKDLKPTIIVGPPFLHIVESQINNWCSQTLGNTTITYNQEVIRGGIFIDTNPNELGWDVFIHHTNVYSTIETLRNLLSVSILFIGDPHFKINNIEYIPLFTTKIINVVNSYKPDFVVVAGDLLDNHDRVDVEPFNLAVQFINLIRERTKTFILVGNHDYKNNQQFLTNNHWMNSLKYWNNVVIVDNITTYRVRQLNFLFVPYVPPGRFVEALETKISQENFKYYKGIFAHQEFYGCSLGAITSTNGDKWKLDWPMVISGHIHNKQWCQRNIYYPGSGMQHAFGQSENNTISMLKFDHNELKYEEIDLKMPKLTIKYLSVQEAYSLNLKNTDIKKFKIVLNGTTEEFQIFKKNLKYKQLLADGIKLAFKLKKDMVVPTIVSEKKFIDVLNKKIREENDPELKSILEQFIFN